MDTVVEDAQYVSGEQSIDSISNIRDEPGIGFLGFPEPFAGYLLRTLLYMAVFSTTWFFWTNHGSKVTLQVAGYGPISSAPVWLVTIGAFGVGMWFPFIYSLFLTVRKQLLASIGASSTQFQEEKLLKSLHNEILQYTKATSKVMIPCRLDSLVAKRRNDVAEQQYRQGTVKVRLRPGPNELPSN